MKQMPSLWPPSIVQLRAVDNTAKNSPRPQRWLLTLMLALSTPLPVGAAPSMAVTPNQATTAARALRSHVSERLGQSRPAPKPEVQLEHEVLPNETLDGIAEHYAVTVAAIVDENQLGPEPVQLEPGQTLTIRTQEPPPPRQRLEHVIRSGDNWRTLSNRYDVDQSDLRSWNSELQGKLTVGRALTVWIDGEIPEPNPGGLGLDVSTEGLALKPVQGLAISVGSANRGRLLNGAQLPENPDLYTIRRPDYAYGSTHMVEHLQLALAKFRRTSGYTHELIVSDMSRQHGGGFGPHESHRSGRDVDIWLPGTDEVEVGKPAASVRQVDWDATWQLVKALIRTGEVQYIFLSRSRQRFLYRAAKADGYTREQLQDVLQFPRNTHHGIIRHEPGHRKHVHVRFHCGPQETRCR